MSGVCVQLAVIMVLSIEMSSVGKSKRMEVIFMFPALNVQACPSLPLLSPVTSDHVELNGRHLIGQCVLAVVVLAFRTERLIALISHRM